jgi:arginine deiminase
MEKSINVSSEVGTLKRLLIHSPDSGLGKVIPSKAQDWLFEDIVHLDTMRKDEYDFYVKILLYFLDPAKIQGSITRNRCRYLPRILQTRKSSLFQIR